MTKVSTEDGCNSIASCDKMDDLFANLKMSARDRLLKLTENDKIHDKDAELSKMNILKKGLDPSISFPIEATDWVPPAQKVE